MKYLCFVLYLLISFRECTVNINVQELVYIADHLTAAECRRFFASLYFESHDLPDVLSKVVKEIPKDIPCVELLIKWNSGFESWEGYGKTHEVVKRRLHQIGKDQLADWLGTMVFHHFAKQVNKSLEEEPHLEVQKPLKTPKVFKDSDSKFDGEQWTTVDTILTVALFTMLFIILAAFCRILILTFRRAKVKRDTSKHSEELVELINAESIDSDQETLYEFDVENRKRTRISFENDLKK